VCEVVAEGHALGVALGGLRESRVGNERALAVDGAFMVDQAESCGADLLDVPPGRREQRVAALAVDIGGGGSAAGADVPVRSPQRLPVRSGAVRRGVRVGASVGVRQSVPAPAAASDARSPVQHILTARVERDGARAPRATATAVCAEGGGPGGGRRDVGAGYPVVRAQRRGNARGGARGDGRDGDGEREADTGHLPGIGSARDRHERRREGLDTVAQGR